MVRFLAPLALVALVAGGCDDPAATATVNGRLVRNGLAVPVPGEVVVTFTPADGIGRTYNARAAADGSFRLGASGGKLLPKVYRISIRSVDKPDQFKAFAEPNSAVVRELKPGANAVVVNIAKLEG
jgi:hypothetical protein